MKISRSRRNPVPGRFLAGALLLAVIGAVSGADAAAARPLALPGQPGPGSPASGQVSWSAAPANAKAPDSRNLFAYNNVKPGSSISDHVAVLNRSNRSVAFLIYATDASGTTTSGALTLLPANQKPSDIGSWATFPRHVRQLSVIIPAGQGIVEPFTVTVPRLATPGDHTGGMIAAIGVPRRTASGQMVTLYQRIAVPIEMRVTGKLHAALQVHQTGCGFNNPLNPFGGGSASVSYTVTNTGNVKLSGTQRVTITGPFGVKSTLRPAALPVVLPGDSIRFTVASGALYPAGPLSAHVTVTPRWPAHATPLAVTLVSASASTSAFAVPWALLVLLILLGGGWYAWRRTVRHRRDAHRAEVAAAAEQARRETERRLLGGGHGTSGSTPVAKAKPE